MALLFLFRPAINGGLREAKNKSILIWIVSPVYGAYLRPA